MPVSPTYPGIYIEELPSQARTITAAPTSTAVFIGYSHPFKTQQPGTAVRVFSFTEFEREFGGSFQSGAIDRQLGFAVSQFFLNGGSVAYVVGLQPAYPPPPSAGIGASGISVEAREPTDSTPITVTVSNVRTVGTELADLELSYGKVVETFRGVSTTSGAANFAVTRINASSTLVTATGSGGGAFPQSAPDNAIVLQTSVVGETFDAQQFLDVFDENGSLDKVDVFNLLAIPGVTDASIWATAHAFCERRRAFAIMDPPANASADGLDGLPPIEDFAKNVVPKSTNAALYFPYQRTIDPSNGSEIQLAPSGYVAGIFARTDNNRGVWKAPAGLETVIRNTLGVVEEGRMTDMTQGVLNNVGVNCLRTFPGVGTVVFGARTVVTANTALQQWRYVPVRRMALFIEQTLYANLGWVVFEPNDEPLWVAIRTSIDAFMFSLFKQGAFQGRKPSDAFLVQCDASTTTQTDIDNGIVNIIVGFRPLKPAEFVIVKIAQIAGQAQV